MEMGVPARMAEVAMGKLMDKWVKRPDDSAVLRNSYFFGLLIFIASILKLNEIWNV